MRIDYAKVAPGVMQVMLDIEKYLATTDLDESLMNLVKIRASQMNGCVWCLDMHTKDAKAQNEDEQKLLLLPAWREAPVYSEQEKAALDWTEHLTRSRHDVLEVSDELFEMMSKFFDEKQIADLTMAIIAINGWNRLNVAFHNTACTYVPGAYN